jgi:hypothetical protein
MFLLAGCAGTPEIISCVPRIGIYGHPDGTLLAEVETTPGGTFALRYIHSVALTPVVSRYRLESGQIVQTAEEFDQHGFGLPYGADRPGERFELRDGRFVLHMHRAVGPLYVRVGAAYDNRLEAAGSLDLTQWGARRLELVPLPCG